MKIGHKRTADILLRRLSEKTRINYTDVEFLSFRFLISVMLSAGIVWQRNLGGPSSYPFNFTIPPLFEGYYQLGTLRTVSAARYIPRFQIDLEFFLVTEKELTFILETKKTKCYIKMGRDGRLAYESKWEN